MDLDHTDHTRSKHDENTNEMEEERDAERKRADAEHERAEALETSIKGMVPSHDCKEAEDYYEKGGRMLRAFHEGRKSEIASMHPPASVEDKR